jgi:DNA polymerase (family 10)
VAAILRRKTPTPHALAIGLRHLALVAELRGELDEARELLVAAADVDTRTPDDLRPLLREGASAPLVSPRALAHLQGLAAVGVRPYVEDQETRLPRDLAGFVRARSLDEAITLHRHHAILGVSDLRARCDAGRRKPERLPRICNGLDTVITAIRSGQPRQLLGRVLAIIEPLATRLAELAPVTIVPVGSIRRFEPTIGDILLLGATSAPQDAIAQIARAFEPADIRHRGDQTLSVMVEREEVNLRLVTRETFGCALVHYTGSSRHVDALRQRAQARGLRFTAHGLFAVDGTLRLTASEADVYGALDLPVIPPELRHGLDEIALAEQGRLSELVTLEDIRGDLHCHTLWSDGRDSTEGVLWAVHALGYEYVAITDHSPTAAAARVLSLDRLTQQAAEIDGLRGRYPEMTILHGTEVDILGDGTLDFPDAVLEGLDIVLASLHESHGQSPDELLRRYVRAMEHPLVNVITHPANRVPGRSEGYALDWGAFFEVAARTGTAVEVDGAPGHLDLDGHLARRASEAGATLTVDSDGHFADRLGRQMRMGIGTARRGAVQTRHVLNTRPLEDVRAFVAAKRRR